MLRLGTLAIVLLLLLAACGGDDDDGDNNRTSVTSTPNAAASTVAPESTSPAAAESTATTAPEEPTATQEPEATPTIAEPTATATVAATATTAATATPAPPTATATPEAGTPDVVVGKWKLESTSIGSVYVMGDVTNQGTGDAISVEVVLTMKDASGAILASESSYVEGIVRAGGKGAWKTIISDLDASLVASTDIIVQWESLDDYFMTDYYTDSFTTANVQWIPGRFVGEVTNTGEKPVEFTRVTVIGYDAAGEVFTVDYAYALLDTIPPGQTSPFEISFFGTNADIVPASYEVFVSARNVD